MALRDFSVPLENFSDVVLIVEDNRLHVEKQYLALYSTFFRSMFYSGFIEEEEIRLEDLKYHEFVELLNVIYPSHAPIKDNTVEFLLRLGDRFGIDCLLRQCVAFFGSLDCSVSYWKALHWVDLYCFSEINVLCKSLFDSIDDVKSFVGYSDLACLSDRVKAAVLMHCVKPH